MSSPAAYRRAAPFGVRPAPLAGRKLPRIVATGALLIVCALATYTNAATFSVDSTEDAVDAVPGDRFCATATGSCTLRAAIQEANALEGEDEVILSAKTYTLTIPGTGEDECANGDLDITDDLTVRGVDRASTIIDGNRLDHVVDVIAGRVSFEDVTIRNGNGNGIDRRNGQPFSLTRVVVELNTADGIQNGGDAPSLTNDIVVRDNGGSGISGLGIPLVNAVISNNGGAGVTVEAGGGIFTRSVFSNNHGVGINNAGHGDVFVDHCVISGNRRGGVALLAAFGGSSITAMDTTVTDNGGSGVTVVSDNGVLLIRTTVSGNRAKDGGGISLIGGCPGAAVVNSTVSGNTATRDGGGIYVTPDNCNALSLINATITNNVADANNDQVGSGGGLFVSTTRSLVANSILAGNTVGHGDSDDCDGIFTSGGHNVIGFGSHCAIGGDLKGNVDGDPQIGPLSDNDGPTATHALLPGSVAIDGGDPAGCTDFRGDPISTDQRGVARPQGQACDIGAFEYACGNGTVDLGEDCDDGNVVDGDCCSASCKREPSLDVDGTGEVTVATDVVYVARRLLGLTPVPPSFRVGHPAIAADSIIAARASALGSFLDVDADGTVSPATDVVYIARHMLGLSPVPPSFRIGHPSIPSDGDLAATIDHFCRMPTASAAGLGRLRPPLRLRLRRPHHEGPVPLDR